MENVKISAIKSNPNNPRLIKSQKFEKLVNSIKQFPQMLELRPIVVNNDMVVLGGNMRLKACKEAGLTEVPIIKASELTPEQEKEFIVKDNVGFGEWDWDILANEWDNEELQDWGMDVWNPQDDDSFELDDLKEEKEESPSILDDGYSQFEIIMFHQNKLEFIRVLNQIKEKHNLEKQEDSLMVLVDYGKRSI